MYLYVFSLYLFRECLRSIHSPYSDSAPLWCSVAPLSNSQAALTRTEWEREKSGFNNFPQLNPRHITLKTNEVPRDSVWKGCQQGAEKEEVKTHFSFLTNQFLWKEAPAILRMVLSLSLVCILSSLSPYLLLHLWKYFCNLIFFFFFFMFLHPFFGLGKFKSSCLLDKMI